MVAYTVLIALIAGATGFLVGRMWSRLGSEILLSSDWGGSREDLVLLRRRFGRHNQLTDTWICTGVERSTVWLNRGDDEHKIPFDPDEECLSVVVASSAPTAYGLIYRRSGECADFSRLVRIDLAALGEPLDQVKTRDVDVSNAPGKVSEIESVSGDAECIIVRLSIERDVGSDAVAYDYRTYRFHPVHGAFAPVTP